MTATEKMTEIKTWWGRHRQSHDRIDGWSIGPLDLICERREQNWTFKWRHVARSGDFKMQRKIGLASHQSTDFGGESISATSPYSPAEWSSILVPARVPNEDLVFNPTYPSVSMLLEFKDPVTLSPNETLGIGFLIPLSMQVEIASMNGETRPIAEVPIHPLAKTWNGTNTIVGEVCFTPHSTYILDRWTDHAPRLDYAACSIVMVNASNSTRSVSNLLLPLLRFSLYHSPQTGFWTDSARYDISDTQSLKLERLFPKEAGQPVLVQGPRKATTALNLNFNRGRN